MNARECIAASVEARERDTNMIGQIRQGDVLLVPVEVAPPDGATPHDEAVLAWGEVTGHAHRLSGAVLDWTDGERRYVRVLNAPGSLRHEDHDPAPAAVVAPGQTYEVVHQREWDLSGQWKKVID